MGGGHEEQLLQKKVADIDVDSEEFRRLSDRGRLKMFFEEVAFANSTMPVFAVFIMYGFIGLVWWLVFYYIVRDPSHELFCPLNMKKFILYNVLHGVLGFGASCGPLGQKFKVPLGAAGLTFLTPGTLCSPLFPGAVGMLLKTPGRRSGIAVALYIFYVAALLWALVDPSAHRVALANAALGAASVFDTVIFFASRGEHYGYQMFCMMFPDWIAGCQWVQLMLWIMVGISKIGPWFKYVIQVLVKDAIWTPCLPEGFSARLFNKDWANGDYTPSKATRCLAHLGALCELAFPLCCTASPGSILNSVGVFGMICYHGFIWCTLPVASVFEWQYYTQIMTYYLYRCNSFALPQSPVLIAFLVVVLIVLPVIGQLEPALVPFLMAYRQYSGNWRIGTIVVRKSARLKLEKIKTWNPLIPEIDDEREAYRVGASFVVVPQFRGQFSVFEMLQQYSGDHSDDFYAMQSPQFMNAAFGWDLAVGWLWYRECFRTALLDICGFEAGECYFFQIEPVKLLPPHKMQYRLFDVTKGPRDAEVFVDIPYAELEGTHPMEVHLKPEHLKHGNSIRGTFLGTYY